MKTLKLMYRATINRLNFGSSFMAISRDFDQDPDEDQLLDFLRDLNEQDRFHANFETNITVHKVYRVIDKAQKS